MNNETLYRYVLGGIVLICLVLLFAQNVSSITGHVTDRSTHSEVTITSYLSIDFCPNLETGILFGDVDSLPATNINASHNYDGVSDKSTFCILISNDSNNNVDLQIKGDGDLTSSGGDVIGLDNETYANFVGSTNSTHPLLSDETSLTTGYVTAGTDVPVGSANYYRFWLDIPGGQAAGTYNNTVSFQGVLSS